MSLNKVLYNLAKFSHIIEDGLSQILLVTDGKNEEQTNSLYNLLKETVFDDNIVHYTTIVRTRFDSFEDEKNVTRIERFYAKVIRNSNMLTKLFILIIHH